MSVDVPVKPATSKRLQPCWFEVSTFPLRCGQERRFTTFVETPWFTVIVTMTLVPDANCRCCFGIQAARSVFGLLPVMKTSPLLR